jgi:hypothetical protein
MPPFYSRGANMIFKGEPNLTVMTIKNRKRVPLFKFDENGRFETKNKELIEKLKPHYETEKTSKKG